MLTAYAGLFLSALLAATVIPAQSETVLAGLLLSGRYNFWSLIAVASLGNTLGALINWYLGCHLERLRCYRWFPVSEQALIQAQVRFQRYGLWSLLLSWMPVIGDPLTVLAGLLRTPLHLFIPLVLLAKTGRYLVLGWLVSMTGVA
ncbi:MAG: DedA family protein [Thiothrix sp.]|nr:DedA family protein [Thiothrix sp.]HPQ96237.1 YqaA family protein [Thiolinea sp.]